MDQAADRLKVLFICTANVCRSPLAAAVLKLRASERDVALSIASAGLDQSGRPVDPNTVAVMDEWGVDVSRKTSRRLEAAMLQSADLVLPMSTHHVRQTIGEEPSERHKVFLFKEFAAIAGLIGVRKAGQSPRQWLSQADEVRSFTYAEDVVEHEIPDPVGMERAIFVALRQEFSGYSEAILDRLFPAVA